MFTKEDADHQKIVQQEAELYLQKQQLYYDVLTQQITWEKEKHNGELILKEDEKRLLHERECRRIAMEKELRVMDLNCKRMALS